MPYKTKQQRKNEIKPWRARWAGTCCKCKGRFEEGALICSLPRTTTLSPLDPLPLGHFVCHPDWFPAPLSKVHPLAP